MSKLSKIQILEYFSFLVFRFRWLSVTTVSSWRSFWVHSLLLAGFTGLLPASDGKRGRGTRGSTQQRFSYWSRTVSGLGQGGKCLHSVHSEPENRAGRGPTIRAGPLEYMASGLPQQSKNAHLHLYTPVLIAHWVEHVTWPCPASRSLEAWGTGGMCNQVEEMLCLFKEYIWNRFLPLPHLIQDLWPAQFSEPPDYWSLHDSSFQ